MACLIKDGHIHVANAGDCRVVLCRAGEAVELSTDLYKTCVAISITYRNPEPSLRGPLVITAGVLFADESHDCWSHHFCVVTNRRSTGGLDRWKSRGARCMIHSTCSDCRRA